MGDKIVAVAGASGVVGQAAVEAFAGEARTRVTALSRRAPGVGGANVVHVPLDLRDAQACEAAIASGPAPTHLVFAALYEKPDLVEGWRDRGQMAVNRAMLRNLLGPIAARGGLRHVALLQGTKAYGVHLHRIAVPARENRPRDAHDNFYWLQEDDLREAAATHGFSFTILRPQIIFGDATGVAMNIIPVLGAYAAIRREESLPFAYPGGPDYLLEAVDAGVVARAIRWAGEAEAAKGATFNVTNGDVFVWRNVWPAIAAALGVATGPDERMSIAAYLRDRAPLWRTIATRENLVEPDLAALVAQSADYADFCFAHGARRDPPPVLVSTIALRRAGFADCMDTEDMFRERFASLRRKRVLPQLRVPPRL